MSATDEVRATTEDPRPSRNALAANMDLRGRDKLPKGSPKRRVAMPPTKAQRSS